MDATIVDNGSHIKLQERETSLVVSDDGILKKGGLFRFDLTTLYNTTPKKAVMALYVEEACASAGTFSTTYDHWDDSEVWSSAYIGNFGPLRGGKWFGFDVLEAFSNGIAKEQRTLTFRVSSDHGKPCRYASLRAGKAAKLMLEF